MRTWKVVCGVTMEAKEIQQELIEVAQKRGFELDMVHRFRKEGILEYVQEHREVQTVLLQEVLQRSQPYTAEDFIKLTDERQVNVIVSLSSHHYGSDYMSKLYAAGLYNAVFEKDADAEHLVDLILQGRTRKEARAYYGIRNFIDQEELHRQEGIRWLGKEKTKETASFLEKWNQRKKEEKEVSVDGEYDIAVLGGGVFHKEENGWKQRRKEEGDCKV